MKYTSPQDIEEMRARNYDRSAIEEAVELSKHWIEVEKLKEQIRQAFSDVQLGNGIGLYEAQGLDDYASQETCAEYRAADEKCDWRKLQPEDLNKCSSSLSFFDAEGMRFHLPAYLIADLEDTYVFGMDYTLTQSIQKEEQFSLLDQAQHAAARAYLRFIEHEAGYEFVRDHIQRALAGYWAE